MVFYIEHACQLAHDYGNMWEQYYDAVERNFDKTLHHLVLNDLWDKYDARIRECLRMITPSGWGFSDTMNDKYGEMKALDEERRKKQRSFHDTH